jgi:hypothetical protein
MNTHEVLAYVHAAAQAVDLPLTPDRASRVADHLGRTVQMARLLEATPLAFDEELAELYVPAPFPAVGEGS